MSSKKERRFSSFQRIGVAIAGISSPFCQRLKRKTLNTFILVDRDQYLDLAKLWDIYGIPSLVVLDKDRELGRFVNRDRKTKAQISEFLAGLK